MLPHLCTIKSTDAAIQTSVAVCFGYVHGISTFRAKQGEKPLTRTASRLRETCVPSFRKISTGEGPTQRPGHKIKKVSPND